MADISTELQAIQEAVYGEEVRGAIVDALTAMNTNAEAAEAWATGGSGGTATGTNNAKYYAEQAASSASTFETDTTLSVSGKAADAAAVGNVVLVRYSETLPESAMDLPGNIWLTAYGQNLQSILGANFTWTLAASNVYLLKKYTITASTNTYRYELYSMGGPLYYTGWTISISTAIQWISVIDDTLSVSGRAADAKVVGDAIAGFNAAWLWNMIHSEDFVQYADVTLYDGWITSTGSIAQYTNAKYTDYLQVTPGREYYFVNNPAFDTAGGGWVTCGAFYDINKTYISAFSGLDTTYVVEYAYKLDNGNLDYDSASSSNTSRIHMYKLTVPTGAYFVRMNTNTSKHYCWSLCTKPIYALAGWGNIIVPKNDPVYQNYSKRKLCMIGPSTVSINRYNPNKNGFTQYLVGYAEYLKPWYGVVQGYGYSGAAWGDAYTYGETGYSIHRMICGDQTLGISAVDLSDYDDFLLCASTNGVGASGYEIGTYDMRDPEFSTDTYMGGLRATIDYIYSQNPAARIFIGDFVYYKENSMTESANAIMLDLLEKTHELADAMGVTPLSLQHVDFNQYTLDYTTDGPYDRLTYDGVHYNQNGMKLIGLYYRKAIIGV